MITVQVQKDYSEKLNQASAHRRAFPWDEAVIDWSAPVDDRHLYMPDEYSFLYGTPLWDRLTFPQKSFVTRWEFTQLMRNAGAGEHLLNQAILSVLHHTSQYDPGWRYMLHEVAEECQHMAMFNEWVRLNPDIRTKGLSDDRWGLVASMLTPVFATQFPVFFWTLTMLLEVVGDDLGRAQAKNASGHLHPIVQQLGKAHQLEEVRHIAFARVWVENAMPRMPKGQRAALAAAIERITAFVLRFGLRLPYSSQLEPHVSYGEFKAALHSPHRRQMWQKQARPCIEQLVELGIVRQHTLARWDRAGLMAAQ